jgi:hypothetical protein
MTACPLTAAHDDCHVTRSTFSAATHHPETGEKLNPIFTMAAFVPANVPICAGMILTAPTVFNTVLWQAVNQSLNAGFNYSNRSGSDSGVRAPQRTRIVIL